MRRRLSFGDRSERGATLIIVALTLVFLMGVAALAVDLSAMRFDLRADRLASDAAATAGVAHVDPFAGSRADVACEVAWQYLMINVDGDVGGASAPNCSTFASSCSPGTARQATASAGPYRFIITHPVPDDHPLMGDQALNPDIDGGGCQRLGVTVSRDRDFAFAPVIGIDTGTTTVYSVARIGPGVGSGEAVPLLVLEPVSCNALFASGQGGITVGWFEDTPGFVVVDSDASEGENPNSCTSGNNYSIDAQGNTNGWIRALPTPEGIPSAILSYALAGNGPAQLSRSYDPNDLTTPATGVNPSDPSESWFRLYPQPQGITRRITRAPIDWRYNCKSSYPEYPLTLTSTGGVPIDPCPHATAPLIDNLVAAYGGTGSPTGIFQRWTQSGHSCSPSDVEVTGDWWVDCPGGFVVNGATVTFRSGDVVFDGTVDLRSDGQLHINPAEDTDRVVFIRNGDLQRGSQSSITLRQTFVYMGNGRVNLVGGATGLTWTAPLGGSFEDLALWSEKQASFEIGGQSGNTLTGTFFTPMAVPFALGGQGGQFQTDAQFLTRRLEVKGQAEVKMFPDPSRQTLIPIREVRLIR